jgi:hypothetical protein
MIRARVAVLLSVVATGVVALALALILRSEVLALVGVLAFAPTLMGLWIMALFAHRTPPAAGRHDPSFLGWLWRRSAPPAKSVERSSDGGDRGTTR